MVDVFREAGLTASRIGAELGPEQVLDLSVNDFLRLQTLLTGAVLCDAGDVLMRARMRKSPSEIALVREACQITGDGYGQTFAGIGSGMTEAEVARAMEIAMLSAGGRTPFVIITSGPNAYDLASRQPSRRHLAPGDMVWMDCRVCRRWLLVGLRACRRGRWPEPGTAGCPSMDPRDHDARRRADPTGQHRRGHRPDL